MYQLHNNPSIIMQAKAHLDRQTDGQTKRILKHFSTMFKRLKKK